MEIFFTISLVCFLSPLHQLYGISWKGDKFTKNCNTMWFHAHRRLFNPNSIIFNKSWSLLFASPLNSLQSNNYWSNESGSFSCCAIKFKEITIFASILYWQIRQINFILKWSYWQPNPKNHWFWINASISISNSYGKQKSFQQIVAPVLQFIGWANVNTKTTQSNLSRYLCFSRSCWLRSNFKFQTIIFLTFFLYQLLVSISPCSSHLLSFPVSCTLITETSVWWTWTSRYTLRSHAQPA